jgi:hypothetical protein
MTPSSSTEETGAFSLSSSADPCRIAPLAGSFHNMAPYDDEDDWVGVPPEGHYSRDRAKPEFWRNRWPLAGSGLIIVVIVLVVILLTR